MNKEYQIIDQKEKQMQYEYIEKDGFSIDRGEYVCNWDDSQYRREEEECRNSLFDDEDDD